jgi:hypothetical protein
MNLDTQVSTIKSLGLLFQIKAQAQNRLTLRRRTTGPLREHCQIGPRPLYFSLRQASSERNHSLSRLRLGLKRTLQLARAQALDGFSGSPKPEPQKDSLTRPSPGSDPLSKHNTQASSAQLPYDRRDTGTSFHPCRTSRVWHSLFCLLPSLKHLIPVTIRTIESEGMGDIKP